MTVLLAASPGGHLDELEHIAAAFADTRRVWATLEGPRGDELRRSGEDVRILPPWERDAKTQLRLWRAAARLVREVRPKLVVTTGAGATVPIVWAARAAGSAVFFVETSARLSGPSVTGRLAAPFATQVFVQWPELATHFRHPTVCRPMLFDAVSMTPTGPGRGTVVFVGTHTAPFRRLLDLVARAADAGVLPSPVVAQVGADGGFRRGDLVVHEYVTPTEAEVMTRDAQLVVCHGGAGTIASALRHGKRPLVLPRLKQHGEHFDDHQLQLVGRLAQAGLVVQLDDAGMTPADVERAVAPLVRTEESSSHPSVADAVRAAAEARGIV